MRSWLMGEFADARKMLNLHNEATVSAQPGRLPASASATMRSRAAIAPLSAAQVSVTLGDQVPASVPYVLSYGMSP
jgi:hypothetical protein